MKKYFSLIYYKKKFISKIDEINENPHRIALGMAIGVFIGISPTTPFNTILAIIFSFILRGSKSASAVGVWIANPITIPFFYIAGYKLGCVILHIEPFIGLSLIKNLFGSLSLAKNFADKLTIMNMFFKANIGIFKALFIGGCAIGLIFAIPSYFLTYYIAKKN